MDLLNIQSFLEFCDLSLLDLNILLSTLSSDIHTLVFPDCDRPTFVRKQQQKNYTSLYFNPYILQY
jgi:hypothetical protein